jgi:hypothetical protein
LNESGALNVTTVPELYVRVKGVEPVPALLLSFGDTLMEMPLEGPAESTVNT